MRSVVVTLAVLLCACGSTSPVATTSPSISVPSPSKPATPPASPTCPSAPTVNAALGVSLPAPVGVAGSGGTQLPAGAEAEACEYHASTYNVIIILVSGVSPAIINKFSDRFPVAYKNVPGVGDQARSFYVTLGGGKDNEGVVATKGSRLVSITATATPATLAQVAALASQLLG
jgi:hypothetical protein